MRLWVDELVSLEVGEFGSWWVGQLLYMLCPRRCCSHDKTISHLSCSRGQVCLPWTGHMSGQYLLIHREHAVYIRNNMSFVKRSNRSLELVQSPQSVPSCSVSLVPPAPPLLAWSRQRIVLLPCPFPGQSFCVSLRISLPFSYGGHWTAFLIWDGGTCFCVLATCS